MGDDDQDKTAVAKAPATIDGLPAEIADFLECTSDNVELTPGKLAWLGVLPDVGDFLSGADITFEAEKDGSVKATAKLGEDAFSASASVKLRVDADGRLAVDASDSTLINAFKSNIDRWTNDVNSWFASNHKQLGPPTVKSGRVTLTKVTATDVAAPEEGAKRGFLSHVSLAEKVGAGALFAVAIAGSFLLLPSDTTTNRTVPVPNSTPASASSTAPQYRFVKATTTESGGPPWSLLLIPGSALLLGGGLVLDEQRRRDQGAGAPQSTKKR